MREERHPGDLREEGRSSARPALIAAGFVLGIALVVCGGLAAHVAWTDAHRVKDDEPKQPEMTVEEAEANLRKIVKIDVPAGLVPLNSEDHGKKRRVVFGRKPTAGFILQLVKVDFSMVPSGIDRANSTPKLMQMLAIESNSPGSDRFIPEPESTDAKRVLTVMGKEISFSFTKGRLSDTQEGGWKVTGMFSTQTGVVALKCVVPESEYDEQAVIRLIESIGPGEDDAATDAEPG
jgi:hypothetical protein